MAISNNVPFSRISEFFADLGEWLVIEFVPKSDSQVQKLLKSREDIFIHYDQENFEKAFNIRYIIRELVSVKDSERILYLLQKRE